MSIVLISLALAEDTTAPPPIKTPHYFNGQEKTSVAKDNIPPSFRVYLEPRQKTMIAGEITSQVQKIHYRMGERFKEGDLLVKLEDGVFESNYQKMVKILEKAEVEESSARRLYDNQAISLIEWKNTEALLATAVADFTTARKFYESTRIFAPYSGKVARVLIDEFELAQPGKEIIEIIDDEYLYAKFLAPGELFTDFYVGRKVTVHLRETNEYIRGKIKRISPIIDAVSDTVKVEAEIDNSEGKWIPGMSGTLTFDPPLSEAEISSLNRF